MRNYFEVRCTILLTLLIYRFGVCYSEDLQSGIHDGIDGALQLLDGIKKVISAGRQVSDPITFTSALTEALVHQVNLSQYPTIEKLYEKYVLSQNSSNVTDHKALPHNVNENIRTTKIPYDDSTNLRTTETTTETKVKIETTKTSFMNNNLNKVTSDNSTLDRFLYLQGNICNKLKYGIESLTQSELITLFKKFLEYDYLKTKESWERIKVTSLNLWDAAVNNESPPTQTNSDLQSNNLKLYLLKLKNQMQDNLYALKRPFKLAMRGIKDKFTDTTVDAENRDFCEKLYDAEMKIKNVVIDLETKLNSKLESEIEKEKKLLEEGAKNPQTMALFDKEIVTKNIKYIKRKLYNAYNYLKTVANNQLKKITNM